MPSRMCVCVFGFARLNLCAIWCLLGPSAQVQRWQCMVSPRPGVAPAPRFQVCVLAGQDTVAPTVVAVLPCLSQVLWRHGVCYDVCGVSWLDACAVPWSGC